MNILLTIILVFAPLVSFANEPSENELFEVFSNARTAISESGPVGTIKYYSREWLEYKLESAFESADKDHSKINYAKDALWTGFQGIGLVNSVYSYTKIEYEGKPALSIKATSGKCNTPSILVYVFSYEQGKWRIFMKSSDSTKNSWLHSSLNPKVSFPHFEPLDRSEIWKEQFGYLPENKPCP